jgi:hypothetical protein
MFMAGSLPEEPLNGKKRRTDERGVNELQGRI